MPAAARCHDAHVHLFSRRWFEVFHRLSPRFAPDDPVESMAEHLGFELPPEDPAELAARWVEELDRHGVGRAALLMSHLEDSSSVSRAVRAFPGRFAGLQMVDPRVDVARDAVHEALDEGGMSGIALFPALHHFRPDDPALAPVLEEAAAFAAPVFIHLGELRIPVLRRLGIPDPVDPSFSRPLALRSTAEEFSDVTFLVPHFGGGRFEETLELGRALPNVVVDTSSSNSWIEPPETLATVLERTLETLGPQRILFGTDSSAFPRGYRTDLAESLDEALDEIGADAATREAILRGNFERVFGS